MSGELENALSDLVRNVVREELAQLPQPQEPVQRQAYFNVKAAAEYTGKTEQAIRNASRPGGRLKSERQGRSIAFSRQALDDWMKGES